MYVFRHETENLLEQELLLLFKTNERVESAAVIADSTLSFVFVNRGFYESL